MMSGLRVTLSKTELQALLTLARYGAEQLAAVRDYYIVPKRQEAVAPDIIKGLEDGLASLRWKQEEAKERREAPKREAERRAAREHHAVIDGYTMWGMLSLSGQSAPTVGPHQYEVSFRVGAGGLPVSLITVCERCEAKGLDAYLQHSVTAKGL